MIQEKWRSAVGYEGLYEVSNHGRIRNARGKILKFQPHEGGYLVLHLRKQGLRKTVLVHRCVAMAFIPNNLNKPEVNHIDGVKSNNYYKNLEWSTRLENVEHSIHTGLTPTENYNAVPVIGTPLNGGKKIEFQCMTSAERYFSGKKTSNIAHCIRGTSSRTIAYGHRWEVRK